MDDSRDNAMGEVARRHGWISQPQLQERLRAAELVRQAGIEKTLADITVDKGFLTEVQAQSISRETDADAPKIVGGFELLEKLGEGGMGAVYKARQISMDRFVALKILPQQLAQDKEFIQRFMREARMAAKLDHINIVRGIDVGKEGDVHYFAMEFVKGESVGDLMKREGALPENQVIRIGIQIARALEHAWREVKLIHRDIKPDNILLTKNDVAKVADLGLARTADNESTMMTRTGVAMGTPHYISPEQARGERDIDARTDIYSLGATFYHMLVGETPFSGSTAAAVITSHLTQTPTPVHVRNSKVSERTSRVVAKMMQKGRDARYADASQLLEDLELVVDGKDPKHAMSIVAGAGDPLASLTLMSADDLKRMGLAPAGNKWLAPVIAVMGSLLVALAVALFFLLGGSGEEEKARRDLTATRKLFEAGNLDAALAKAYSGAEVYAETEQAEAFRKLAGEIAQKKADAKKAEEEAAAARRAEEDGRREAEKLAALKAEARGVLGAAEGLLQAVKPGRRTGPVIAWGPLTL